MTLAQETEIKLINYEGLKYYDDLSVMQVSGVPHSEVLALQECKEIQDMNAPTINWKANHTCYKCREKGHLAQE